MANSPALSVSGVSSPASSKLASMSAGRRGQVVAVLQEPEVAAWLRAVGLREGAEVVVLRRAPFGGPIHVRTSDGGEFALHRDLARSIDVTTVDSAGEARGRIE